MPGILTLTGPMTSGGLDRQTVRRYLRQRRDELEECYKSMGSMMKDLASGDVRVSFVIASGGTVTEAEAIGDHPDVDSCIAATISQVQFPKSPNGAVTIVQLQLTYKPPR